MNTSPSYLLRTESQINDFRSRYGPVIEKASPDIIKWFNALPLFQWVPYQPPGDAAIYTGLLCILYIEGKINITFSKDMASIERGARSDKEYEDWASEHYTKPFSARHFDELKKYDTI